MDYTNKAVCEEQVSGPGKFEGESPETYYFYSVMLDGDGEEFDDEYGQTWSVFRLDQGDPKWVREAADKTETAEQGQEVCYLIRERDNGFVDGYWTDYALVRQYLFNSRLMQLTEWEEE